MDVGAGTRRVDEAEARTLAEEEGATYTETSAKTSEGVREAVLDVATRCYDRLCEEWAAHGGGEEKIAPEPDPPLRLGGSVAAGSEAASSSSSSSQSRKCCA